MKKYKLSIGLILLILLIAGCRVNKSVSGNSSSGVESSVKKSSKIDNYTETKKDNSAKKKDSSERQEKFAYSLVGTWHSTDSKITYYKDGTLKQVSDASGMVNTGKYKIISESKDSLTVQQRIVVKDSGENVQNETFRFSSAKQFSDGLVNWENRE